MERAWDWVKPVACVFGAQGPMGVWWKGEEAGEVAGEQE